MIGRLSGKLAGKHPPQVLVDVTGVAYELDVPMSTFYSLPATGEQITLYTHLIVREDAHMLYGFATLEERTAFRQLIRISGVGARTALAVLSGLSVADLAQADPEGWCGHYAKGRKESPPTVTNTVNGRAHVTKTTNGSSSSTMAWTFKLYSSAGTLIETKTTPPNAFYFAEGLTPGATYRVCETGLPAGWTTAHLFVPEVDGPARFRLSAEAPGGEAADRESLVGCERVREHGREHHDEHDEAARGAQGLAAHEASQRRPRARGADAVLQRDLVDPGVGGAVVRIADRHHFIADRHPREAGGVDREREPVVVGAVVERPDLAVVVVDPAGGDEPAERHRDPVADGETGLVRRQDDDAVLLAQVPRELLEQRLPTRPIEPAQRLDDPSVQPRVGLGRL